MGASAAGPQPPIIKGASRKTTTIAVSLATGAKVSVEWRLLFRASENEYSSREFHRKCDGQGPTVTLVKAATGKMAAAYAGVSWNLGSYSIPNPQGFIAQFDGDRGLSKYSATRVAAIWNYFDLGPTFSFALRVSDNCDLNEDSHSAIRGGFYVSKDLNLTPIHLFGTRHFVVEEYEVYQIVPRYQ